MLDVDLPLDGLHAVAVGEADAYIGVLGINIHQAQRGGITNLKVAAPYDPKTAINYQRYGVRKDWPVLADILDKALSAIPEENINRIFQKWVSIGKSQKQPRTIKLTAQETAWLKKHPVIRVAADPAWAPIEFLGDDGNYKGLSIDYLNEIESILGIRFEFIRENWQELIARAKKRQVDLFPCVAKTSVREKFLVFTKPYIQMPTGIFVGKDVAYISDLDQVSGKKIAVVEGYAIHDHLVASYPDIDLVLVKTPEDGINYVKAEKAFAFIGNTITTGHLLSRKGDFQIKLAGEISFMFAQNMGVRKDWPLLRDSIQKAIETIPDAQRNAIYNQWVPVNYEKPTDYSLFWKIAAACLVLVFAILIWNRKLSSEVLKRTSALQNEVQERKQAQLALKESEEKFRALADTSPIAIYMSEGVEQRAVYLNPTFTKLFGYTLEEVPTVDHWWPLAYPNADYRRQVTDEWQKKIKYAIETKTEIEPMEVIVTCKNGSKKDISWGFITSGKQNWACGFDLTERKQAEKSLRENETFIKSVLNNLPIGVAVNSVDPTVEFSYMNDNFPKFYRTTREKLADPDTFWESVYEDPIFREEIKKKVLDDCESGDPERMNWIDVPISRKGEKTSFITARNIPIPDKKLMISTTWDVTERKQAEKEKVKLESQLRQAAKIEAVGTLAGGIAHDFNNILGIIIGNTELAMDDVPDRSPVRQNLDQIKTASLRARDVVRQLLSFSRKTEQEKESINIHTIITESIQLLRASIPSSIDLISDIPTDLKNILGDPTQIHQVIINLCTNAAHAMEKNGGTMKISLSEIELDNPSSFYDFHVNPGSYIQLTINDTGCGIDPKIIDRIFDPYFTTKETDKGTGIGLSVVHGIVKNHDGAIFVNSKPGKGTTVNILFPLIDKKPVRKRVAIEELPKGNENVLFVDDESALLKMGQQMLKRLGYQVRVNTNPVEALELFSSNPNQFDLVITDMTMPQMTGEKLVEKLLEIKPDIPIILCTGYSKKINRESAAKIGIKKYIEKPLRKRELSLTIREVLDKK